MWEKELRIEMFVVDWTSTKFLDFVFFKNFI